MALFRTGHRCWCWCWCWCWWCWCWWCRCRCRCCCCVFLGALGARGEMSWAVPATAGACRRCFDFLGCADTCDVGWTAAGASKSFAASSDTSFGTSSGTSGAASSEAAGASKSFDASSGTSSGTFGAASSKARATSEAPSASKLETCSWRVKTPEAISLLRMSAPSRFSVELISDIFVMLSTSSVQDARTVKYTSTYAAGDSKFTGVNCTEFTVMLREGMPRTSTTAWCNASCTRLSILNSFMSVQRKCTEPRTIKLDLGTLKCTSFHGSGTDGNGAKSKAACLGFFSCACVLRPACELEFSTVNDSTLTTK
mmetsp:Transcript_17362/g.47940  ORF Transcript_17362/g.47940 Transcript_17362/m.47940 type:complete len:312 (+) Transcript_17362:1268-2203(+)